MAFIPQLLRGLIIGQLLDISNGIIITFLNTYIYATARKEYHINLPISYTNRGSVVCSNGWYGVITNCYWINNQSVLLYVYELAGNTGTGIAFMTIIGSQ